jgi:hypothetical protein
MASPFLTAIEPHPSSAFLWGHVNSTRALLQSQLVLLREKDSFELGVIAMTIHHEGQPR